MHRAHRMVSAHRRVLESPHSAGQVHRARMRCFIKFLFIVQRDGFPASTSSSLPAFSFHLPFRFLKYRYKFVLVEEPETFFSNVKKLDVKNFRMS